MKDANRTRRRSVRGYADGGPVMTAGPRQTEAERDNALQAYGKRPPPNRPIDVDRQPPRLAGERIKNDYVQRLVRRLQPNYKIDQSGATKPPTNATKDPMRQLATTADFAKGGPIKKVAGKPRGKEDGTIAVQLGEYVVSRASVKKYGAAKMGAVNKGTAKVTAPKKR